jgi:hypothetical protein
MGRHVGQQVGTGRRAELVVDHGQASRSFARRSMVLAKLPPRAA